ncbi:hypothetical protein DXV76_19130 [Rhodobacteraceae bacterium CCMM004]|nr:hypothetical protein DXV76_19130 [Rhodobacteraceae bacterium CCMM004]
MEQLTFDCVIACDGVESDATRITVCVSIRNATRAGGGVFDIPPALAGVLTEGRSATVRLTTGQAFEVHIARLTQSRGQAAFFTEGPVPRARYAAA